MRGYPRFVLDLSSIVLDLSSICPRGPRSILDLSSIQPHPRPWNEQRSAFRPTISRFVLDLSSICPRFVLDIIDIEDILDLQRGQSRTFCPRWKIDLSSICPRFVLDLSSICLRSRSSTRFWVMSSIIEDESRTNRGQSRTLVSGDGPPLSSIVSCLSSVCPRFVLDSIIEDKSRTIEDNRGLSSSMEN